MIEWILGFRFNSLLGVVLYWAPLGLCVYGYTIRTWVNYRKDKANRDAVIHGDERFYAPTDTIGTLVGRALVAVLPIANLWASTFDVAPELFGRFFRWIGRVLDTPLVPRAKRRS